MRRGVDDFSAGSAPQNPTKGYPKWGALVKRAVTV